MDGSRCEARKFNADSYPRIPPLGNSNAGTAHGPPDLSASAGAERAQWEHFQRPRPLPGTVEYDEPSRTLHVGDGAFAPVDPEIWSYSVSGLKVVQSWLGYRSKSGAGRTSSPLDAIRPERWPAELTEELLELILVLEHTLALEPQGRAILAEVASGAVFSAAELPQPAESERRPPTPKVESQQGTLDLG